MLTIISTKRYNSKTGTKIAEKDHYNDSGNYTGTTYLMVTPKGNIFCYTNSNGQDLYRTDAIWLPEDKLDLTGYTITDEALCVKHQLITEG